MLLHPENIQSPILSIENGIVTLVRLVHPLKREKPTFISCVNISRTFARSYSDPDHSFGACCRNRDHRRHHSIDRRTCKKEEKEES